jgi:phosphoribosylamine--glycine ligase
MRVLVIGAGGREHAIVWKLHHEGVGPLHATPGNPGIAEIATCLPEFPPDHDALGEWAERYEIDLTLVGPEAPLASGLVDVLTRRGLRVFGPTQAAATLESSKVFMKTLCHRYGIPTAPFRVFDHPRLAIDHIRNAGRSLVIKADGLAAGKGVVVADTAEEGVAAIEAIMVARQFGDAGARVVIEAVLEGEECSVLAFADGTAVVPFLPAQDYKRLQDGDRGPNTGGMGACAPVTSVSPELLGRITNEVLEPVVWAMAQEGRPYRGVLYAGLMLTAAGPQVLEFNARFGDPEAQVLLPLLESGLGEAALAVLTGRLDQHAPRWRDEHAVCVVLASEGYPGSPRAGVPITGLEEARAEAGVLLFHAGTAAQGDQLVSRGGRVLNAVGIGATPREAMERAYRAAERVQYAGKIFRRDIGPAPVQRARSGPAWPEAGGSRRPGEEAKAMAGHADASPLVGIVIGSDSDLETMEQAGRVLQEFGVAYEITIASAHRSPARVEAYAQEAEARGLRVLIAGAGAAAHLAGVLAGRTALPVIGVPLAGSSLGGLDALLSTVQMPSGVPVATVGIGGARNAALLAVQILGTADPDLRERYRAYKERLAREVEEKAARLTPRSDPGMVPRPGGRPR